MSLRTSRWILRLLLLPYLLPNIVAPFSFLAFNTRIDNVILYLILIVMGTASPGIILFAIWEGYRDSARIADRRQANRYRALSMDKIPFAESVVGDEP